MDINEVFDSGVGFVALAAAVGIVLLIPLYLSQRRDVHRLRAWREREPGYADEDLSRSEESLDRAETELEELLGELPEAEREPEPEPTPTEPVTAAYRVTHERPALERITMERAALEPHPRWRRFAGRATRPRVLVMIAAVALLLGAGAILVSEELLKGGEERRGAQAQSLARPEITVAVLNGTSISGLADDVGSDLKARGYRLGALTTTTPGVTKTVVMFAPGSKAAAHKVARDLEVKEVERADREALGAAGKADVIVIAGEDRANA